MKSPTKKRQQSGGPSSDTHKIKVEDPNDKDKQAKTAYLSIGIVFTSALIICSIIGFTQLLLMQKSKE